MEEKIVNDFLSLIQPDQLTMDSDIKVRYENRKAFISLYVKQHPYHDDVEDFVEFDFDNKVIVFAEQDRIVFQEFVEKMFTAKDETKRLKQYYTEIVEKDDCFDLHIREKINDLVVKMDSGLSVEDIKPDFLVILQILNFTYKEPPRKEMETMKFFTDKVVKAVSGKYTESWLDKHKLLLSFEQFEIYFATYRKNLSVALEKIKKAIFSYCYGKQITEKIIPLIQPQYKQGAYTDINRNVGGENPIVIRLDNNPWRNGLIKGDIVFAAVKFGKEQQYMLFKKKFSCYFDKLGIKCTSNTTEKEKDMIRVNLPDFKSLLDSPTEEFIKIINDMYIGNISFPEFGCCSKHMECTKADKCLHLDSLYATACQYQKMMKRSGKFENS